MTLLSCKLEEKFAFCCLGNQPYKLGNIIVDVQCQKTSAANIHSAHTLLSDSFGSCHDRIKLSSIGTPYKEITSSIGTPYRELPPP